MPLPRHSCVRPQEANDAVFELNERLAGQEAELAAAREALAAHQQQAATLEVGGWGWVGDWGIGAQPALEAICY